MIETSIHPAIVFFLIVFNRALSLEIIKIKTILNFQKKITIVFLAGILEVSLWLFIVIYALDQIRENVFYALIYGIGFGIGSVVGVVLEGYLPWGSVEIFVFSPTHLDLSTTIHKHGFAATAVQGRGKDGEVEMIYSFLNVKDLKRFQHILPENPHIFYTLIYGGKSNKMTKYM